MSEYLIQGETLTAIADKIRTYLNIVGDNTHKIKEELTTPGMTFVQDAIQVYFYEDIDNINMFQNSVAYLAGEAYKGGINAYNYLTNNEGKLVPVIYSMEDDQARSDPYFYVGTDEIFGEVYDKWRKIETTDGNEGSPNPEENYTWDSRLKNYIYTNRVVEGAQDGMIAPQEFPAKIDEIYEMAFLAGQNSMNEAILGGEW